MFRKLLLLAVLCLPLSCGFHLRGSIELPALITPLYLEHYGADNGLSREIRNLLSQSATGQLVATREAAAAELRIINTHTSQRVVAVDNRGRARQYELNYRVNYSVSGEKLSTEGDVKEQTREVRLKRDLLFDPDSVLAIGHEQEKLYQDMRKDAARMIMRQLRAMGQPASEK